MKPVQAIRGFNQLKRIGNGIWEPVGRPDFPFSQDSLQFGPHLFDRIQIGAIRWQIKELNIGRFKDLPNTLDMMRAKIIHNDNISPLQRRDKIIPQISGESISCRSARVGHGDMAAIRADGGQYRRRLGRIQGGVVCYPCFANTSPVNPRHVGVYAAFVQIDKMVLIKPL